MRTRKGVHNDKEDQDETEKNRENRENIIDNIVNNTKKSMSDGWIELENGLIAETSEPPRPSFFISRSELPAAKVEHKKRVPLWSIIKSAMGKNLYDEHLPIEFYEPLSLLQCLAEPLQV
uniref:Uncharacterized protein n=1 Tax=Ditylenchus dipsaci TaxID=166011 RepID=A0A915E1U8_9BILA